MDIIQDQSLALQLGKRIKCLRKRSGFSQEMLSVRSGLHRTYIGSCERGEKNITLKNAAKIASALGVSLHIFFEGM